MLKNFESDTPHSEIFPVGYPFKSLYAIHSLRKYIASQSQKVSLNEIELEHVDDQIQQGSVNEAALTRAISLIVAAISDPNVISQCGNDDLKDVLALHMMDCLLHFLKGVLSHIPVIQCLLSWYRTNPSNLCRSISQ